MTLRSLTLLCVGVAFGAGLGMSIPRAQAQTTGQNPLTVRDFPDLQAGLKASPGCIDVKATALNGGKMMTIFAWFKNKAAVDAWYNSPMHREAMRKFFPNLPGKPRALSGLKDENIPLLVVATVTPSDKPMMEGSPLAISQIAIEIYSPVPGGITYGGGFGPKELNVPGMVRLK